MDGKYLIIGVFTIFFGLFKKNSQDKKPNGVVLNIIKFFREKKLKTNVFFLLILYIFNRSDSYCDRRIHRGLYMASDGSVLNADINGSINILKKYFKERKSNAVFTTDDVRVLLNAPCERLYVFPKSHKSPACG